MSEPTDEMVEAAAAAFVEVRPPPPRGFMMSAKVLAEDNKPRLRVALSAALAVAPIPPADDNDEAWSFHRLREEEAVRLLREIADHAENGRDGASNALNLIARRARLFLQEYRHEEAQEQRSRVGPEKPPKWDRGGLMG